MITRAKLVRWLVIVVLLGGVFLIVRYTRDKPSPEPPARVSIGISATSLLPALIHIADSKGFFRGEGLDVEIEGYPTGKAALAATLNGEVDMGTVADIPIVSNSFERDDFAVWATIVDSAQHAKALARKDRNISTPRDLLGKTIATSIGTTSHFFMVTFFALNRMDIDQVEIVDMKPSQMVEAIVNGEVDAIFGWEPNVTEAAERLGDNALLLPSEVGYMATFNLASTDDFIEDNPESIRRVIRALTKAEEFAEQNREESVDILASRLETDREDIDKLWDGYEFRLSLSQSLLITLENEAKWSIRSNFTNKTGIPNFLDYIYMDALDEIRPESISIIH